MIGFRDCATFNLSGMECEIYTAMKRGDDLDAVRKQYGLTQNRFERVLYSIKRKMALTKEFNKKGLQA